MYNIYIYYIIDIICQIVETHFGAFWLVNSFFSSKYVGFDLIRIFKNLNGDQNKYKFNK